MAVRRFQTPSTSSKVGRDGTPGSSSLLRRSVATHVLRLPLSSDDHDPPDMSDRRKRPVLPHIQVTRRSDRQDSCDQRKRHSTLNRRLQHLRTNRQSATIHNRLPSRYSPTNRHNRHSLRSGFHDRIQLPTSAGAAINSNVIADRPGRESGYSGSAIVLVAGYATQRASSAGYFFDS